IFNLKTVTSFLCGLVFLISGINVGYAQMIRSQNSNISVQDTIKATADTSKNHLKLTNGKDTVVMKDESGLETVVTIVANDSSWNEVSKNIIHLYSGAKVKYQDFELSADYIRLDRNTNMLYASGVTDHTGKYVGRPV